MFLKQLIRFIILISIALCLLFSFSCRNDDDDGMDTENPLAELISPMDQSIFESNEMVNFSVKITDASTIVSYKILIRNTLDESLAAIKSEFNSTNEVEAVFDQSFEVPELTLFDIEVEAIDDFDNVLNTKIGSFQVNRLDGGTLNLNFNVKYDGEPFEMFKHYDYPSGGTLQFTRLSFYFSEVNLSNGLNSIEIMDVDYLNMTSHFENPNLNQSPFVFKIGGIDAGTYQDINFNVGLNETMNAGKPFEYFVTEPLGLSGEYWPSWNSYVFFKLDGMMDTDGDGTGDLSILLHLGGNEALRNIQLNKEIVISQDSETELEFNLDVRNIFLDNNGDIYDIISHPEIHTLEDLDQVIQLADNLKNSIN